jgi:hypothetical protein
MWLMEFLPQGLRKIEKFTKGFFCFSTYYRATDFLNTDQQPFVREQEFFSKKIVSNMSEVVGEKNLN